MTKLVTIRLIVAIDDQVFVDQVKAALREHIESLPVQTVGDADAAGRIHWSSVDVLRDVDRGAVASRKAKKVTTGQGVLG